VHALLPFLGPWRAVLGSWLAVFPTPDP